MQGPEPIHKKDKANKRSRIQVTQINTTIGTPLSKKLREWHYNNWSMLHILLKMR